MSVSLVSYFNCNCSFILQISKKQSTFIVIYENLSFYMWLILGVSHCGKRAGGLGADRDRLLFLEVLQFSERILLSLTIRYSVANRARYQGITF